MFSNSIGLYKTWAGFGIFGMLTYSTNWFKIVRFNFKGDSFDWLVQLFEG
jgi:hypothetical protein